MYTSGSSGQPKAAIISHAALGNYLRWCTEAYDVARGAGAVVSTSVAFDATVTTLFPPLLCGRAVVMVPEDGDGHGDEIAALAALVASGEPLGPLKLTPAHIDALRATGVAPRPGRVHAIVVGGEPMLGEHVAWCRAAAPEARIFNEYGPTETTVGCSIYEVPPGPIPAIVPIGRPIANTRLYVLDAHLAPVPIGVTGELYIGGAGVAAGYHARPELTAERFLDDPFSSLPGARMYRTGDLAAYLPDGNLRFLGRRDGQVKLRGFRIELAEIEAALARHAGVGHAAVVVQRTASGDPRLVAFVVAAAGAPAAPAPEALRRYLADELPDHMVPSVITIVPALPLTPNGKVDRRALPVPSATTPRAYTAPATAVQEAMCEIAAELLGVPRIGIHDNFFELGGHSLLATQFVSRVRSRLHVDLTVRLVFKHPTMAALALRIEGEARPGEPASAALAAGVDPDPRSAPIPRISREGLLPASPMQQRIFAIDQASSRASSGSSLYNMPAALKLRGALDRRALEHAIEDLVRRHEALRTIFALGPDGASQIIRPPMTWSIPIEDLGALAGDERAAAVNRIAREEALLPFDLTRGPLLRTRLVRIAGDEHVFMLTMHHIVSDGWSMATVASELNSLYNGHRAGSPPVLSPLDAQYVDFVAWQRQWLSGAVLERELGFWVQQLRDAPVLDLPLDRPRPDQPTFHGQYLMFSLDAECSAALARLGSARGATLFMTLLAIFQVLLYTYSAQDDLCVATTIAGRTRAELERLVGFFINRMILRARVSDNETFSSLLQQVRDTSLAGYAHQDVPFDLIVQALGINAHPSLSPLCQAMFVLQNMPPPQIRLDGLEVELLEFETDTSKFDLALVMSEGPAGLTGRFEYKTALFDEATIVAMAQRFEDLVQVIVRDPDVPLQRLRARPERGIPAKLAT
jgi:non-ribosomal peptide synthetase component F